MSPPLRQAARVLYDLRQNFGDRPFETALQSLTNREIDRLLSCWQLSARPKQLRPEDCQLIWLRQAGRGEGKTRSAAEELLDTCEDWGPKCRGIIASKTHGDVRAVMIKGESGLEACARRRGYSIKYVQNHRTVYHPSGAELYPVTSEKPDYARGLQCNVFWLDEISSWMHAIETFDNIMFAWRLPAPEGSKKGTITTTPKPNPISFRLMRSKEFSDMVTITRAATRENRANLDRDTVKKLEQIYLGTRVGRQELEGELLDSFGAIIDQDLIHRFRVRSAPEYLRKVVSLDPSITAHEESDAAGIVVVGADDRDPSDGYLLSDYSLEQATFGMWARQTVHAFLAHDCECVVAEVNQGGGGIAEAIKIAADEVGKEIGREVVVPVRSVWARESKHARAEPIGALYERGRIHHVGHFLNAERELSSWVPGMASPNIMDAIVHGFSHLLLGDQGTGPIGAYFS